MTDRPRLLFHVQHMLGIGHRVRAERIARACVLAGFDVTLIEGGVAGQWAGQSDMPGLTRIQLPPAKAADADFSHVLDAETGLPINDVWRARRLEASLAAMRACRPDILLVEGFPFARRAFRFELVPLIEQARAMNVRTAVSIRDILVIRPDRRKNAEIAALARDLFDIVLVHGDPGFVQLADSFSAAAVIADRVVYTGIVSPETPADDQSGVGEDEVIVSAGGGATGGALIRAALGARPLSRLAKNPWRILIGPNLPEADRMAIGTLPEGVIMEPAREDFTGLLSRAALSISQAGYNTVADLAVTGCPAILVPFEGPMGKETEQPTRARLIARAGRAVTVPEPTLTPESLAGAVDRVLALPRPSDSPYRLNGATCTAAALRRLLDRRGA